MTSTFPPLTGIDSNVTPRMSPSTWTLLFIQETRSPSGFASSLSDSSASARTLVVSANMTPHPQNRDQGSVLYRLTFLSPTFPTSFPVHANVEECLGKNISLTYPSVNLGVVGHHSSLCTETAVWGYSAEGQNPPEYSSIDRVERLAEIHIGCQQPSAEVTHRLSEYTEYQDGIYWISRV